MSSCPLSRVKVIELFATSSSEFKANIVVFSTLPPTPGLTVLHPGLSPHGAAAPGLGPGQQ